VNYHQPPTAHHPPPTHPPPTTTHNNQPPIRSLKESDCFAELTPFHTRKLGCALKRTQFLDGDVIVQEGVKTR